MCNTDYDPADNFFRPYACTNVHEFFAVSVENFFERPAQFKNELPELYDILTQLLKQDPLKES
ncbi:MAG: zinc-dependent peptidase [Bacteroidota bacterium]